MARRRATAAAPSRRRRGEERGHTMRTRRFSGGFMRAFLQAALAVVLGLSLASYTAAYTGPPYPPGTGINGTVHDLGTSHNGMNYVAIPADSLQRVCIFCHAPHHS